MFLSRLAQISLFVIVNCLIALIAVQNAAAAEINIQATQTSGAQCKIIDFTVHSDIMDRDVKAVAVVPSQSKFPPSGKLPILYALHGRGAPYKTYASMTRLHSFVQQYPMIVVSFDGDKSGWYIDSSTNRRSQFTSFFFEEYMPAVEKAFPASGVRGITGFSMGGYGAMHFTLTQPEMFVSTSGMSSAVDWIIAPDGSVKDDIVELMGSDNPKDEKIQSLRILPGVKSLVEAGKKLPPIYQHCGTEDDLIDQSRRLRDLLIELNAGIQKKIEAKLDPSLTGRAKWRVVAKEMAAQRINFFHTESPGAHNWNFWHGNIENLLMFHHRSFEKAAK